MGNKFEERDIMELLEENQYGEDLDLDLGGLAEICQTEMDEKILDFIQAEEGMYSYILLYNLENMLKPLKGGSYKSMRDIDDRGLFLTGEFLRITMVRTASGNENSSKLFMPYIKGMEKELKEAFLVEDHQELLGYSLGVLNLLGLSFEFFVGLSHYFNSRFKLATRNISHGGSLDLEGLEASQHKDYHDFNILGHFKEGEADFFRTIIGNLEAVYSRDLIEERLDSLENKGLLLATALYDGFLFNLSKNHQAFKELYQVINAGYQSFMKDEISEYSLNIILGYIVMGMRYSFDFYQALKEYLAYRLTLLGEDK